MSQRKKEILRLCVGFSLFVCGFVFKQIQTQDFEIISGALFVFALIVSGIDVILKACKNILHGQVFDECFLMTVATIGAFLIGEYAEGAAVMLFYQLGELFQSYAVGKSRKSIAKLMDIRPDSANLQKDGEIISVDPYDVSLGDIIVIKPGEKVPLDCIVTSGSSFVDTRALTGESVPQSVKSGDELLSGCINESGVLQAQVTKVFEESTVSKILELVENAADNKSKSENFITKFARYYTPAVVITAFLLAVIPPIFFETQQFSTWIYRALTFLVISCPCALVISVPMSFFCAIGACSKHGILVKGSNFLEDLSKAKIGVFDKTGTLTKGVFHVSKIAPKRTDEETLLEIAAYAESFSSHPIATSIKEAYVKEIDSQRLSDCHEVAGHGVFAVVDGTTYLVGNDKLMKENEVEFEKIETAATVVHVAGNGEYLGYITISDEIRQDSKSALALLKKEGIAKTVMLTGDTDAVGTQVAKELGIDEIHTQLLPSNKVECVQSLLSNKGNNEKLFFVGDGINDAPVLALSDLGIAMGGIGSDAAIEAADIVIMNDEPSKIVDALKISRKTLLIVKENIVFALGVKFAVLILGALGLAAMWAAVFADVGVAFLAIINALRILKYNPKK